MEFINGMDYFTGMLYINSSRLLHPFRPIYLKLVAQSISVMMQGATRRN